VLAERPVGDVSEERVREVLGEFTGVLQQVPPMTSALKRDGKPLYELARQGVTVEREPRTVNIERFELVEYEAPRIIFDMTCSKGTYVRTVASDVGDRLGPGGHLGELRRMRVGRFTISEARPLDEVVALREGAHTLGYSMYDALGDWPSVTLDEDDAEKIMCGGAVGIDASALNRPGPYYARLTRDGSSLLAVARVETADGYATARPVKVFETL